MKGAYTFAMISTFLSSVYANSFYLQSYIKARDEKQALEMALMKEKEIALQSQLNSLKLQINPHFTNALPEGHKGETREQRIRELLVVAPELTIIGLPEGNWITVSKGHATLGGPNTTYVFKAGEEAVPLEAGHRF